MIPWKSDIIVSQDGRICFLVSLLCFSSSFFSLHSSSFLRLEKSGAIHFTNLHPCFPSFGKLSFFFFFLFFFFFNLYFCWSYSTAPTAHRRQGGLQKEGWGEGRNSLFLCQRVRRGYRKRKKTKIKTLRGKNRKQQRDSSINKSVLSSAGFITNQILIAFTDFSWTLNHFQEKRKDWYGLDNTLHLRQMAQKRGKMKTCKM